MEERIGIMMILVVPTHLLTARNKSSFLWVLSRYSSLDSKKRIISLSTVSLLLLVIAPNLTLMCAKSSLMVFEESLMRLVNMDYLVVDDNRLFMEYWNFWKASDRFCWRCNFRVDVFFSVYFFDCSFSLLFLATILYCDNLAAVR